MAMFQKLVSNLPFSPALVGQIGFYARRLRNEEATRRLGLFMTVLALIVQTLTVFVPPTSANGSNANDMCPGVTRDAAGANRIKDCYNDNSRHFRDIMNYFGVSKTELWKALDTSGDWRYTTSYGDWYTFGHVSRSADVKDYSGSVPGNLYARKWKNTIQTRQWGWKGGSGETSFIILADCGNLVLKRLLKPTAKCVSLSASKRELLVGESLTLTARGYVDDGAEIAKYDFSQDGPGTTDATTSVSTKKLSATWQRTLTVAGTYNFKVNIDTTNNKDNLTGASCTEQVTVKVPQKCPYNPSLPPNSPDCKPPIKKCPYNPNLPVDSPDCKQTCKDNPKLPGCNPDIEVNKTAVNTIQGNKDATTVKANGGDVVAFTITATNHGNVAGTIKLEDNLTDVLEYATLSDLGAGTFDQTSKVLSWGMVNLEAGKSTVRTFSVKLHNEVSGMAQNHGSPDSYDCLMSNVIRPDGEGQINIPVNCPVAKEIVEQTVKELPSTGPGENMLFAGGLLAVVVFFWARSKQLGKEVRLVRKDFSAGTL